MTNDSPVIPEPLQVPEIEEEYKNLAERLIVDNKIPDTDATFKWESLQSKTTFRLLGLQLTQNGRGVCEPTWFMQSFDLRQNIPYNALSYTWGDQPFTEPLHIQGKTLLVTKTVWSFLHNVWAPASLKLLKDAGPSTKVFIWIDAVCIDQKNLQEKSDQVELIGSIFSYAQLVTAWLGDATDEHVLGLNTLIHLNGMLDVYSVLFQEPELTDKIHEFLAGYGVGGSELVAAGKFLSHAYFTRTWIVQEVSMAKKLVLQLGTIKLHWDLLAAICKRFSEHPAVFGGFDFSLGILLTDNLRQRYLQQDTSLKTLTTFLHQSKIHDCSDPRDKIFAILGLSNDIAQVGIEPDYTKSVEEVYHALAISFLQSRQLPFLFGQATPRSKLLTDLPSWVPDWSDRLASSHQLWASGYTAGGPAQAFGLLSDQAIVVKGQVIDEIRDVVPAPELRPGKYQDHFGDADTVSKRLSTAGRIYRHTKAIGDWLDRCIEMSAHISGVGFTMTMSSMKDNTWRVLICDRDSDGRPLHTNSNLLISFQLYRHFLKSGKLSPEQMTVASRYGDLMVEKMSKRAFALTQSSRCCVVPGAAEPGDIVCVFQGFGVPYILRRQENGAYRMIGEAYVDGCMEYQTIGCDDYEMDELLIE